MLAARDQENLVAHQHNGATLKQQQQTTRQRFPKTPMKIPLNDENAGPIGGTKSILGKGNENAMTSKGFKGMDKSNFVTPMEPRTRAVLGNKTTNAKAKGQQTINVKSAARELEKSQVKAPTTVRPKQKQPQAEVQKLQVHSEEVDPLSEEEPEYCPPRPKDLPYESDVFPDGVLTFEGLKPENLFKGYYQHYFNPVDESGKSLADRQLEERNRKAMEECDRRVQKDMDELDWSIGDMPETKDYFKKNKQDENDVLANRKPLDTLISRTAAGALAMDDTTKSLQRKAARVVVPSKIPKKTPFSIPRLTGSRRPAVQPAKLTRKTSMEIRAIEANSRTTIGYNKGRATAAQLAKGTVRPTLKPGQCRPKSASLVRPETTCSSDSDKTITQALFAHNKASAADEDQEWKERVPFLSIFNPDDDDCDLVGGELPGLEDDEEFEMQLPE